MANGWPSWKWPFRECAACIRWACFITPICAARSSAVIARVAANWLVDTRAITTVSITGMAIVARSVMATSCFPVTPAMRGFLNSKKRAGANWQTFAGKFHGIGLFTDRGNRMPEHFLTKPWVAGCLLSIRQGSGVSERTRIGTFAFVAGCGSRIFRPCRLALAKQVSDVGSKNGHTGSRYPRNTCK